MSLALSNLVLKTKLKLSCPRKCLLYVLAHHANDNRGLLCFPSIETLSQETSSCRRQVINDLNYLQEVRIIKKEKIGKNNYYIINEDILKNGNMDKSEPIIGACGAPEEEMIGARHSKTGASHSMIGARHSKTGACGAPNNKDINIIKKDITKNFLENEKRREENHISTIVANPDTLANLNQKKERPTDEAKQNARKCLEEAMKKIHEGALKKNET